MGHYFLRSDDIFALSIAVVDAPLRATDATGAMAEFDSSADNVACDELRALRCGRTDEG